MIERVGPEAFDRTRLVRPGVVVVGFLADWCPYCVRFWPALESLQRPDVSVLIADLSDESSPLWETFEIAIVPTLLVFADGRSVFRADGVPAQGLGPPEVAAAAEAADRAVRQR